jgi:predicted TIM-barrel fold metal-dependent hydrolase
MGAEASGEAQRSQSEAQPIVISDAQVHFWQPHSAERPWPAEQLHSRSFLTVAGARPHRAEPVTPQEFLATMDATGVQRAVIVPPSPVGDSNLYALESAALCPERLGIMGRFDPEAPGAREALEGWRLQPSMLGIRMTWYKPRWSKWLDDDSIAWFWAGCERLGIPVMMLMPGMLHRLPEIATRHPGLTLIIDHLGRKSELRDDACFADLDEMLALARFPNISVKASAAPCYSTEAFPFSNLRPYLRRIFDAFGAQRLMWGSDFSRLPCGYRECVDHFLYTLDFMDAEDKRWVMGRSLETLLRWPVAAPSDAESAAQE